MSLQKLEHKQTSIAYHNRKGISPGIVFLSGFNSDMSGTKAMALDVFCEEQNRSFIRFDYRGHGLSSGDFKEFCISDWLEDTLLVLDHLCDGPQILVGSSMGGWLMLLASLARPEKVLGLVGIASAPDFTQRLIEKDLPPAFINEIETRGYIEIPCDKEGDKPFMITKKLIEDGRKNLLLGAEIPINCPVRLIHGMQDKDVPYQVSLELAQRLTSKDVELHLVKDGEHRMSRETDLSLIHATIKSFGCA